MEVLKEMRKEKGLTARELGEKVGVSESAISQYENGVKKPSYKTLLALAAALDVSVDYLSGNDSGTDGAQIRRVIFENEEQRILFDASKAAPKSALLEAAALIQRYKEKSNGN